MSDDSTYKKPNGGTSMRRLEPLKEATASLGLKDDRVVKRLIRENKLKALKIGGRIYITTQSLDKFVGR